MPSDPQAAYTLAKNATFGQYVTVLAERVALSILDNADNLNTNYGQLRRDLAIQYLNSPEAMAAKLTWAIAVRSDITGAATPEQLALAEQAIRDVWDQVSGAAAYLPEGG